MKNEILREVWDNRDKFARRHKHNLNLMAKTLREVEHRINNQKVDPTRKKPAKHRSVI
jgi:hypothetical protein